MELFLSALGLVFVLEGLPYFAFPEKMKGYLLRIAEIPEGQLRVSVFCPSSADSPSFTSPGRAESRRRGDLPMKLQDFDYHLPESLIAQAPLSDREGSRMMVVDRASETVTSRVFSDLPDYFDAGDVLVLNESKVIPARLTARKASGGTVEILLLRDLTGPSSLPEWEALLRPGKRVREGTAFFFSDGSQAKAVEKVTAKKWVLRFNPREDFETFVHREGQAPLPPYIKRKMENGLRDLDLERYQTVYARVPGSIAAPTAGLHFTGKTLERLYKKGVRTVPLTLHVGLGTFQPVEADDVEDHRMESESYEISREGGKVIETARRVTAVGTTSTRVIETIFRNGGEEATLTGNTSLFIYPGFRFRRVDRLVTNFHLPRSSLFLLVCAFAGRDLMLEAYGKAVAEGYRFYSYGDVMLIL